MIASLQTPRVARLLSAATLALSTSITGALAAAPPDAGADEEAESDAPEGRPATSSPVTDGSIVLVARSLPQGVDLEDLRARLRSELGAPIRDAAAADRLPRGTLFVEADESEVTARFEGSDGAVTQRTVPLPKDPARAMSTIVLVAGNVARDEAAELRAQLTRRRGANPASAAGEGDDPDEKGRLGESDSLPENDSRGERASLPAAPPAPRAPPAPPARPVSPAMPAHPGCGAREGHSTYFAGADLVPMLGTSLADRGAVLHASLNVVAGLAGGIHGVQIGSAVNVLTGAMCGLQIGGAANITLGDVEGLQIGGAVSTGRTLRGVQISGAMNLTRGARGVQIAGALNLAGSVTGAQVSGAVNLARGLEGVQIGVVDASLGDVSGAQIGVVDFARDVRGFQLGVMDFARDVRGFQLGVVEVARDVSGAQLGVVNVARRAQGVQLGVVNVADDVDFALGVVSIVRKGRLHMDVWGSETGFLTAAVKHGGRHFHNFYGVGVRPLDGETRVAFTLGVGGHFPLSSRFFLDVDGLVSSVHATDDMSARPALLTQIRPTIGLRVAERLALTAGPSYNVSVAESADAAKLSAIGSSVLSGGPDVFVRGWPGFSVGLQVF